MATFYASLLTSTSIVGSDKNDRIYGSRVCDDLFGGEGDDVIYGGRGIDTLWGEEGDDRLYGGDHNDDLYGGDGDDYLSGGDGRDMLSGGEGVDVLVGGSDTDALDGGDGDDFLIGGTGLDYVHGGDGDDTFLLTEGEGYDWIRDFVGGEDRIQLRLGMTDISIQTNGSDAEIFNGSDLLAVVDGAGGQLQRRGQFIVGLTPSVFGGVTATPDL